MTRWDYRLGLGCDVDEAKALHVYRAGFTADYDMATNENYRIVQLTRRARRPRSPSA